MKGAGVRYRQNGNQTFFDTELANFINDSEFDLISAGSSGVTFKCTKDTSDSFIDTKTMLPVHTILMKFVPISVPNVSIDDREYTFLPTTDAEFRHEVKIQQHVTALSDNICPSIIYSKVGTIAEINDLFGNEFIKLPTPNPTKTIGFIVMELIESSPLLASPLTQHASPLLSSPLLSSPLPEHASPLAEPPAQRPTFNKEDKIQLAMARAKFLYLGALGITTY